MRVRFTEHFVCVFIAVEIMNEELQNVPLREDAEREGGEGGREE